MIILGGEMTQFPKAWTILEEWPDPSHTDAFKKMLHSHSLCIEAAFEEAAKEKVNK